MKYHFKSSHFFIFSIFIILTSAAGVFIFNINQQHAAVGIPFIASVDTMKESKDQENSNLTSAQIANDVNLAASLNVTHITVDTQYEYPQVMAQWVQAIRAAGKKVWFRPGGFSSNGAYPRPTYLSLMKQFIISNPNLFQSGDVMDGDPETENSSIWQSQYGGEYSTAGRAAFNQFLQDLTTTENQAFQQLGKQGIITTIHSVDPGTAQNILTAATVQQLGVVTVDAYPDQNTTDPATAAQKWSAQLNTLHTLWPNAQIVIGEWGYSNTINVDDPTQAAVIKAECPALMNASYLAGTNYWVGAGTQNSGGFTHIFSGSTGNWSLRPGANELASCYKTKVQNGNPSVTLNPTSQISQTPAPTNSQGGIQFQVTICPHGLGNCGDNANANSGGNTSPLTPQRQVSLTLFDANNQQAGSGQGTVRYNATAKNFQGTVSVGNLSNGSYLTQVKLAGFLPKQLPGIIAVNSSNQTITFPQIALVNGDINNDNQLDIQDYNLLIGCFGSKSTTSSCQNKTASDINDDSNVDGIDYNLFLRELSVQR